jgi:hypothetical protein
MAKQLFICRSRGVSYWAGAHGRGLLTNRVFYVTPLWKRRTRLIWLARQPAAPLLRLQIVYHFFALRVNP